MDLDAIHEHIVTPQSLHEIPRAIGVYLFEGRRSDTTEPATLYVGKAKNLQSRVRQYFLGDTDTRPFVQFIRSRVERIHYVVVETEQDALLLENEFIKKFRPPYNIHLRDDKRYLSLRLDLKHQWPKVDVVRKIKKDRAVYLGPFSSSTRLRMTLDFMQKIFPLRTCSDHKLYNRSRPCIEYELKRCVAPCVNYVTPEDYQKLVQAAVLFLKGKNADLIRELKEQMEAAASAERYEDAAKFRDRIDAISMTTDAQSIIGLQQFQQGLDQDAIGIAKDESTLFLVLLFIRSGVIFDQRSFEFKNVKMDSESFLIDFLEHYYASEVYIPHEILIPSPLSMPPEIESKIFTPKAGEKRRFLEVAEENARVKMQARAEKTKKLGKALTALQHQLAIVRYPEIMDCMDISHHSGSETVASVVRFRDGMPEKNGYRKIKLSHDQIDDFQSMQEALERRYKTTEDLPNLLVIDGGRGQLSSAHQILEQRGWLENVDLVALAKARDYEGIDPMNPQNRERIFKPNQKNPILLKENSAEELLMRFLRDEAHRFAITYHRLRKERGMSTSVLDQVQGMTARLKLKLLRRFGSVDAIAEAGDLDVLKEIPERVLLSLRAILKAESAAIQAASPNLDPNEERQ